ncbi:MAG: sodium:solute symporter family protein [Candidatus Heteroscillospira sp.]|jgi:SSS family solute:Na+ symporter
MGNLDTMQLIGIVVTILAFAAIGILSGKRIKTKSDYYVGGRSFGTVSVAATTCGMYVGGGAVIGTAQLAFTDGFSGLYFSIGCCMALVCSGVLLSGRIRKGGCETIQEMIRGEFGQTAGLLATLLGILAFYINCISQFFSGISLIGAIFPDFSIFTASVITALLILVCVYMGGFLGMSLINVIKTAILMLTVGAAAVFILTTTGALSALPSPVPAAHLTPFPRGMNKDVGSSLSAMLGIMSTQSTIQAIYAAKSDKSCRVGFAIGGLLLPVVGICCVLIGVYMRSIAPDIPSLQAFPQFIIMHTHGLVSGIILATTLIAVATAGVSLVLGISGILVNNLYLRLKPDADTRGQLAFSRGVIVAILVISVIVINCGASDAVLQYNFLSMGLRSSVLFLPMCASLFLPGKISRRFATASIVLGPVALLLGKYALSLPFDCIFFGLMVNGAIMLLGYMDKKLKS